MVWWIPILILGLCPSLLGLCFCGGKSGRFRLLKRCLSNFIDCSFRNAFMLYSYSDQHDNVDCLSQRVR